MPDIALWDSKGSVLTSWLQRIKFGQIGHDTFLELLLFKKLPVSAFGRQVIDLNGSKTNKSLHFQQSCCQNAGSGEFEHALDQKLRLSY